MPFTASNTRHKTRYLLISAAVVTAAIIVLLVLSDASKTAPAKPNTMAADEGPRHSATSEASATLLATTQKLETLLAQNAGADQQDSKAQALIKQANTTIAAIEQQTKNQALNTHIPQAQLATPQTQALTQQLNELNTPTP